MKIILTTLALVTAAAMPSIADTALPITKINFAGAGGIQDQRYGTFVVPDRDTSQSAYGGQLSRYDVHLAKMIEVAQSQWCDRPNYKGVHYNYFADDGKVFMGKFYISCRFAKTTVQMFGLGLGESTVIHDRDNARTVSIPVLKLTGKDQIRRFKIRIDQLKPGCLDKMCPGDRSS
jgi:hypothetical protein